jgi:hypothetical protein
MRYTQSSQIRLQERYSRLYKASWKAYSTEAGYLVAFIQQTPALNAIVQNLERLSPELDPPAWTASIFGSNQVEFPPTEIGRAKLAWHLLRVWSRERDAQGYSELNWAMQLTWPKVRGVDGTGSRALGRVSTGAARRRV